MQPHLACFTSVFSPKPNSHLTQLHLTHGHQPVPTSPISPNTTYTLIHSHQNLKQVTAYHIYKIIPAFVSLILLFFYFLSLFLCLQIWVQPCTTQMQSALQSPVSFPFWVDSSASPSYSKHNDANWYHSGLAYQCNLIHPTPPPQLSPVHDCKSFSSR